MSVTKESFGRLAGGREVFLFMMENRKGMRAGIINYGAIIQKAVLPGDDASVVLGFDSIEGYLADRSYQGAVIGRYANRIKGGRFRVNGVEYSVTRNEGGNCLHGGGYEKPNGHESLNTKLWEAEALPCERNQSVRLRTSSPDGEHGFPGNLDVTVTYTLTDDNALRIEYEAVSDRDTIINLTNHAYFNLSGAGSILDHELIINSDGIAEVDGDSISTGEIQNVLGTPLDFTSRKKIGRDIDGIDCAKFKNGGSGYDMSYGIRGWERGRLARAASLFDGRSGRTMETWTDMPAVQLYSGNFLSGDLSPRSGLCLETQFHPDTPNHPAFPQCTFRAGEKYYSATEYRFG